MARHCEVTRNPCGTDTWMKNHPCQCPECQAWMCEEVDALRAERDKWEAACEEIRADQRAMLERVRELTAERDRLLQESRDLLSERDGLLIERNEAHRHLQALLEGKGESP